MKVRALIVEDEIPARITLKSFLRKYFPDIIVVGEIDNTIEASRFIDHNDFEILFLDVQLKDGKATDMLQKVKNKNYRIIFTTAFENYALDAFKFKSFGYLMKPIDPSDFKEILLRVLKDLGINMLPGKQIKIPFSNGHIWVNSADIIRCESESNYTIIHVSDGSSYTLSKTLKLIEFEYESLGFIRIHQSHLVNIRYLKDLKISNNTITLLNGETLPVSRSKRDDLIAIFTK